MSTEIVPNPHNIRIVKLELTVETLDGRKSTLDVKLSEPRLRQTIVAYTGDNRLLDLQMEAVQEALKKYGATLY